MKRNSAANREMLDLETNYPGHGIIKHSDAVNMIFANTFQSRVIREASESVVYSSLVLPSRLIAPQVKYLVPFSEEIGHFLGMQWREQVCGGRLVVCFLAEPQTDWHAFSLYPSMIDPVTRELSRLFSKPELCRDPHWLQTSVNYNQNLFPRIGLLASLPPVFQPLVIRFSSTGKINSALKTVNASTEFHNFSQ